MENLNTQVDLYLTEISIELLGNKIYNINGERKHRLTDLFKALPEHNDDHSNDLLCSMEYEEDFTEHAEKMEEFLDDQIASLMVDANSNEKINQSIRSFLRQYKLNQDNAVKDMSEVHVKKLVERNRILSSMNKVRQTAAQSTETSISKSEKVTTYYENEREQLLKSVLNIQRLIKYVINDTEDDVERGELIGFVHALRIIRESDRSNKEINRKIVKPYKKL